MNDTLPGQTVNLLLVFACFLQVPAAPRAPFSHFLCPNCARHSAGRHTASYARLRVFPWLVSFLANNAVVKCPNGLPERRTAGPNSILLCWYNSRASLYAARPAICLIASNHFVCMRTLPTTDPHGKDSPFFHLQYDTRHIRHQRYVSYPYPSDSDTSPSCALDFTYCLCTEKTTCIPPADERPVISISPSRSSCTLAVSTHASPLPSRRPSRNTAISDPRPDRPAHPPCVRSPR